MFIPHVRAQVLVQGGRVSAALFDHRADKDRSFRVKSSVTAQGVGEPKGLGAVLAVEFRHDGFIVSALVRGEFEFLGRLVFAVFVVASKNDALLLPMLVSAVAPQMILVFSFALRRQIADRA